MGVDDGEPFEMLVASDDARSGEFFAAISRKQRWRVSRRDAESVVE